MGNRFLALVACALASFVFVAASAQAASSSFSGSSGVNQVAKPLTKAPKAPKATPYATKQFYEGGLYLESTINLYTKTKTWEQVGWCDHGSYTLASGKLTLTDECAGATWSLAKVKKEKGVYYGTIGGGLFEGPYNVEMTKV
jgi:hypothetical protein